MDNRIYVKASQPQHTPAGRLLGKMYYGGFLDKVLTREESHGYPHNGGEHSLSLHMPAPDVFSFLDVVGETFPNHDGTAEFIASVKARISQQYPALACA
jgi:hypothetical protein